MATWRIVLTVLAYIVATFAVQGTSHFVLNTEHYRTISFLRAQPVFALGLLSMIVQGLVFAFLFPSFNRKDRPAIQNGVALAWILGAFLASYEAFAEPGKYAVPSIAAWTRVELTAAAAQFTLFGILLGLIHKGK